MLFNSLDFIVFFPVVVCGFFLLPHACRWVFLLGASYYFYSCWNLLYLLLIIAITLITYCAGLLIGKTQNMFLARCSLIGGCIAPIIILIVFKYLDFLINILNDFSEFVQLNYIVDPVGLILPIGISFYTFQVLSYVIDVYRRDRPYEGHLGIFSLYVSFFPQLVAGPIERSTRLLPQFKTQRAFDYDRVTSGMKLMLWGWILKVVIADNLSAIVDRVYTNPAGYSGTTLLTATYFFAFQIYCDFAGYSNIAIGAARILGYDLIQNFHRPYLADSIADFWRRWHISLSTWFKDYLYIPLGGNRTKSDWQNYFNIMVVFLLSGLWHGANWTFVIWGSIHGVFLVLSRFTRSGRKTLTELLGIHRFPLGLRFLRTVATFGLVAFAWIFFRASSVSDAFLIISKIATGMDDLFIAAFTFILDGSGSGLGVLFNGINEGPGIYPFVPVFGILFLLSIHLLQEAGIYKNLLRNAPISIRWLIYYAGLAVIFVFGRFEEQQFIYFQF